MLRKHLFRPLSLTLLIALALADVAPAQFTIKTRDVTPPIFTSTTNLGAPGNTQLMGTSEDDLLRDAHPNDTDVYHDGPGGSDGVRDYIEANDGDGLDTVYAGPEDSIKADDGDTVIILPRGGGEPLWSGSYAQYKRMQALVRWIRDQLQALFATSPTANEPDFWLNAATYVSVQLSNSAPNFVAGESLAFESVFALGPYEVGDVPESPLDCLDWMPYYGVGPLEATASIDFDADEYAHAAAGAQALLNYLIGEIADQ